MDHSSTNGMSVVAIDEKEHRVVGAFILVDLLFEPEGFVKRYTDEKNNMTPLVALLWHLDEEATKKMPELGKKGKAVDLFMLAVHPDYRGRKLANHLMQLVTKLAIENGTYQYATIEATSFFTSCAAKKNNFTAIHEVVCKDWLYKGKPFYTHCKEPHGKWIFWVKEL